MVGGPHVKSQSLGSQPDVQLVDLEGALLHYKGGHTHTIESP